MTAEESMASCYVIVFHPGSRGDLRVSVLAPQTGYISRFFERCAVFEKGMQI